MFWNLGSRKLLGEFFGTFVHVYLLDSTMAQVLVEQDKGLVEVALAFGVSFVIGNLFGFGHINPAVSLGLGLSGKLKPSHVLSAWMAQFSGGTLGLSLVWLLYGSTLENADLLPVFSSTNSVSFWGSVWCSTVVVLAFLVTDFSPALVGLALTGTKLVVGQTCVNPARDLVPHSVSFLMGKTSFPWAPLLAPHLGSALAVGLYFSCLKSTQKNDRDLQYLVDMLIKRFAPRKRASSAVVSPPHEPSFQVDKAIYTSDSDLLQSYDEENRVSTFNHFETE